MSKPTKTQRIAALLHDSFENIVIDLYNAKLLSSIEIADYILKATMIHISPRTVQRYIKLHGLPRSRSESYILAIKKGRKSYDHLRKPITSSELRKGISLKKRYQVFRRDKFKCLICGKSASDGEILVVDHIISVVKGGDNSLGNLRVLCRSCNHGKMLVEERYE